MGFSAKAQAIIDEIGKADDWGLSAAAFELPPPGALTATDEAQAIAEIKLDLALLKYARFARGGRAEPIEPQLSDRSAAKSARSEARPRRDRGLARARRLSPLAAPEA